MSKPEVANRLQVLFARKAITVINRNKWELIPRQLSHIQEGTLFYSAEPLGTFPVPMPKAMIGAKAASQSEHLRPNSIERLEQAISCELGSRTTCACSRSKDFELGPLCSSVSTLMPAWLRRVNARHDIALVNDVH